MILDGIVLMRWAATLEYTNIEHTSPERLKHGFVSVFVYTLNNILHIAHLSVDTIATWMRCD